MKKKVLLNIIFLLFTGIGLFAQPIVLDSIVRTNVTCNGYTDGALTIYVSGGSGTGFFYELRKGFTQIEVSAETDSSWYKFEDYGPNDNYLIIISDSSDSVNPIFGFDSILGPEAISITSSGTTDLLCASINTGTVTVDATGEGGNLRYYLTGPRTEDNQTGFFENLPIGTYQVEVKDDDLCPSTDVVSGLNITAPPLLTVSDNITDATCFGFSDGEIDITANGGTPGVFPVDPYTYDWSGPGVVQTDEDQTGLIAGDYSVIVTDGSGCTVNSGTLTVDENAQILMSVTSFDDVRCNGFDDGKVNISVTNGVPPLDFSWVGANDPIDHTSTKRNADDLYADLYTLTITGSDGCIAIFPDAVEISEPDPITITIDNVTEPTCFGFADGSVEVTINGGTAPYVRTDWTGPVNSGIQNPTNILSAGVYTLEVEDSNGCIEFFTGILDLGQPDDITATLLGSSDALCFGSSTGTAQVLIENGTPGYSYLWTGDVTGHTTTMPNPDTLKADTYDLEITDSNGCLKPFDNIVIIGEPFDITSVINVTDVLCNGGSTGAIEIIPSGGTGPGTYSYAWTGAGVNPSAKDQVGLAAGFYEVTVTDGNGCTKEFNNIEVKENSLIEATPAITDLTCFESADGAIDPVVSGGVGPYDYSWTSDLGYLNNIAIITNLDAANYTLTVTDAESCFEVFTDVIVDQPVLLTATFSATDATCFQSDDGEIDLSPSGGTTPYQFTWTGPDSDLPANTEDISSLETGDYSLYLRDANGCDTLFTDVVSIGEPDDITITPDVTDITCAGVPNGAISVLPVSGGTAGYTYQWSGASTATTPTISDLGPGQYDLTIIDSHTCPKTFTNVATLSDPPAIVVTFDGQDDLDCFGDNVGSIQISASGGTGGLTFNWTRSGGAFVSALEDPIGILSADIYSLEVTDGAGCSVFFPDEIEITQPDEVLISLEKTDINCYGDATGTITVTTTGGVGPPYQYRQLGFAYQASNVFTDLTAGTYTIYTKDANDCETSDVITINQPGQITYSDYGVSGSNKCNGDADATIYINTVNGGVPPYQYTINGGTDWQLASSFPNLPGGSYDVRVKDDNSCERTINNNLLVDEPFPITISYYDTVSVSTCYDTPEGQVEIMANGGSGTLQYSINGGATQATGLFTGLIGGSYDVQIIDDSLCTKDTIATIDRPSKVVFNQADTTGVTGCFGDSTGELDVNAIGGTGLKQYSLDGVTYQGSGLFTGLWASDTTVFARDAKGCPADTTVTITQPDLIAFTTETATDVGCNGESTGTVTAIAFGGTKPYTYSITSGVLPDNDSGIFVGVPAGVYTVEVNDASGCGPITSIPLTVNEPAPLMIDSVKTDFISCNGANDAEIHIYVSGGTPPYTYSYDNGATYITASSRTNLGPDTYDVSVMDGKGCIDTKGSYTFVDPPVVSLNAILTHVSPCFGGANGAIEAAATGGWESFEYSIDGVNYQASGDFNNLTAGDYVVFTRDTGTCLSTLNVSINEPDEITATVTKTDYVDEVRGTITISNAAGGVPPYEYTINGLSGTFTADTSYIDLVQGTYDVVVRDDSGCNYIETVQIDSILPLIMLIDSADVSCFGADDGFIEFLPQDAVGEVQYSIDDGASFGSNARFENLPGNTMYILMAFDEDGKRYRDSVFIAEPPLLSVIMSNLTPAQCNAFSETGAVDISIFGGSGGYTISWSNGAITEDLTDVVAGVYSVEVTDNTGCSETVDISIPGLVIVNADAGKDTTICQGESVALNGKSGDVVLWEPSTYLSNRDIADPVANNVQGTISYTYTETSDLFGCYDIDTLTINVLPTFGIEAKQDTVAMEGQLIQLEAIGGPFESYVWTPSSGLNDNSIANPEATAQTSITYYVNATNEFGCVEIDSLYLEVIEDITVYNAFSPNNGDDINQYFEIDNAANFPDMVVEVYNRWGSRVFSSVGYSDDKRWDGTANGKDVPIGTYYYIIIPYPDASPITGNVTIIR